MRGRSAARKRLCAEGLIRCYRPSALDWAQGAQERRNGEEDLNGSSRPSSEDGRPSAEGLGGAGQNNGAAIGLPAAGKNIKKDAFSPSSFSKVSF